MSLRRTAAASIALLCAALPAFPRQQPAGQPAPPAPTPLEIIRRDAEALRPLAASELCRDFLEATALLPSITPRKAWRDKTSREFLSEAAASALAPEARGNLEEVELDERFYYNTRYGSPLAYARPLDVVAAAGFGSAAGRKILDFGYGSAGHLRLLASLGAEVVGVEVDPLLKILYADPSDQGIVGGEGTIRGRLTLVHGQWPAAPGLRQAAGSGFDLVISKNVLKNGYIHPAEPVDPRRLVHLGVDDEAFVRALFEVTRPGGFVLVYNLSPAPAPAGKPYIPWADGRSPFPAELWRKAGFEVIAFDKDDSEAARAMGRALGWDQGERPMDLQADLFALYTLARRPA
ncbi:MAG TPA: class I SAM-dependent methyltransferase [Candidatus Polarisedimenticolia bacterium]|nr:class I SAM-dependent methyltransferase [Candidatus Polarisedimenticolia bacterium]